MAKTKILAQAETLNSFVSLDQGSVPEGKMTSMGYSGMATKCIRTSMGYSGMALIRDRTSMGYSGIALNRNRTSMGYQVYTHTHTR